MSKNTNLFAATAFGVVAFMTANNIAPEIQQAEIPATPSHLRVTDTGFKTGGFINDYIKAVNPPEAIPYKINVANNGIPSPPPPPVGGCQSPSC
jgi:hypothetical protein